MPKSQPDKGILTPQDVAGIARFALKLIRTAFDVYKVIKSEPPVKDKPQPAQPAQNHRNGNAAVAPDVPKQSKKEVEVPAQKPVQPSLPSSYGLGLPRRDTGEIGRKPPRR